MILLPQNRLTQVPLLLLAVSIIAGMLLGEYSSRQTRLLLMSVVSVACLFPICVWLLSQKKFAAASLLIFSSFFVTGIALSLIENRPLASDRIKRLFDEGTLVANDPVELTGVVQGQPESAPNGFYATINVESIRIAGRDRAVSGRLLLLAHLPGDDLRTEYDHLDLRHGARIRVMTALDRDEDYRNPGVLRFTEYLDRKDYDATGVIKSPLLIERLDDARVFLPLAWLYEWRERLGKEFERRFSPETAGVLDAVLLGNRYKVSRAVADRFRAGGTFHVLVIAGLHISFIAGVMFLLMRRLTRNRIMQFVCAVSFLFAYAVAVGGQAPVMRAALVFTLGIFAPIVWRRANSLNVIAGAALVLLVWRPNDLFDPSFQLTFLSVISIVTIAVPILRKMQAIGSWRPTHETPYPPVCPAWFRKLSEALFWSERGWKIEIAASNIRYRLFKTRAAATLEDWRLQRLFRFATAAIIVSASVQVGMLPVLIIYFHRISFASLLLNIFVGMAMAAVAGLALVAIVIAQFSSWAATPLVWLTEKFEWAMVHAVDPFTHLGIASIRLPSYRGWMAGVYFIYFVVLGFLALALARWNPLRPPEIEKTRASNFRRLHIRTASVAFASLLLLVILHPLSAARADGKLHLDFLDVGQGDCALVTMPDGTTVLVDGGGRPNIDWKKSEDADAEEPFDRDTGSIGERVVSEYLWARGLDRVDYILPTHADADHMDGLNDVARNFRVRGAIVARTPTDDPEFVRFAETMRTSGVPIEKISAGDVLRFGDVALDVLWPPASSDPSAPYRNNDGLVLRVRHGEKVFLFLADIEKQTESALLRTGLTLRCDLVKVAHHGSRTSSIAPLVAATHSAVAIISVGRTSIFGHPHKEVVERWRASGAKVMTTGENGTISVVSDGKELRLSTFVQK